MAKKEKEIVELKNLDKKRTIVTIKGITPLLMEKMDMEVVKNIDKKKSKKTIEKDDRAEVDKLKDKIHYTEKGNVGFPAIAFHKAMIESAVYIDGLDKKLVRGSVRILGGIIPIEYSKQVKNETWGKTQGITKSPRLIIRPEFKDWKCKLDIIYNNAIISINQIVALLDLAGFQIGVGGWRPEKSGNYGQFEVER